MTRHLRSEAYSKMWRKNNNEATGISFNSRKPTRRTRTALLGRHLWVVCFVSGDIFINSSQYFSWKQHFCFKNDFNHRSRIGFGTIGCTITSRLKRLKSTLLAVNTELYRFIHFDGILHHHTDIFYVSDVLMNKDNLLSLVLICYHLSPLLQVAPPLSAGGRC